jgi:hypothetical protein
MTKGGSDIVTDEYTATHDTAFGDDRLTLVANSIALTTNIDFATNDGSNFVSDSFQLEIVAAIDPEATTNVATLVGETTATLNGAVDETGGASVDYGFDYRVVGAGTWTNVPKGTTSGTLSYTHALTGLTESTEHSQQLQVVVVVLQVSLHTIR